ncbi:MAG: hypothetical protein KDA20_11145 [Phycisphaerales bacterium]|nr:hypothetical protein [Phycisphaerales bacterium]
MSTDVFFYEAFEEEEAELRRCLPDVRAEYTWAAVQETGHTEPPAPIISVRTQSLIPADWAPKLKGILSRSTGYDHLDRYAASAGVQVARGYLPLYCARAVAEHALMMWMALLRKLETQRKNFQSFSRDGLTGGECAGRTLLVVGVGNIGYEVVKIGRGLDMQVLGVDLVHPHADVFYRDFEAALPDADIIVCCMNLTQHNVNYFNAKTLANAKPGAVFVNVSRGELSPGADLLQLLERGVLGGVGLDVFDAEANLAVALRSGKKPTGARIEPVHILAQREDVILTPHNAFNSTEAVARKSEHSGMQIRNMLSYGQWLWPVPTA